MNVLWTVVKIVVGLVVLIPLGLIALGLVGTVLGLAIALLRLALLGLLVYGAFKLIGRVFRRTPRSVQPKEAPRLTPADPYFQAAMRDLDQELPEARTR
jgi:hypothetical protein